MNDEFIYLFVLTNKRLYIIDQLQFSPNYQPTVGVDYGFKIHRVFGKDCMYHVYARLQVDATLYVLWDVN